MLCFRILKKEKRQLVTVCKPALKRRQGKNIALFRVRWEFSFFSYFNIHV